MTDIRREQDNDAVTQPHRPNRILVASSGDASSLGAIRVGLAIARRTGASVQALAVATMFPHIAPSPMQAAPPMLVDADNEQLALEAVRRQLADVPGTEEWTLTSDVGYPPERIVGAAERWPASLLVIGTGEHGTMDRLLGSETAVKIARRSKIPVLAVPEDASDLPERAAAAIDFTESSIAAAELAATLVEADGMLTLVHASVLVNQHPEPGSLPDVYTEGAIAKLDAARARIQRTTELRIETVVLGGAVTDALLSYVEREKYDLLAVGGHDQGFLDSLLLGSVRSRVLRRARCQVLIAPHSISATE